jgi:hypothetical protein
LPSAKQWLDQHGIEPVARNRFEEFPKPAPAPAPAAAVMPRQAPAAVQPTAATQPQSPADQEALFKQFQAWEAERNASAQTSRRAPAQAR